jgi:hypothetical protein
METHIARQGKIILKLSKEELFKALKNGTVLPADHWWRSGMKDWKKVAEETPLEPEPIKEAPKAEPAEADWRTRPKHRPSHYGDVPATEKQLALIQNAGLTDIVGLTKYDASRWIDLILGTEEGRQNLNDRQFQVMMETREKNEAAGLGCDGHRTPSGQYREEIKYCLTSIAEKKEETRRSIEEDPESEDDYLSDLKDEVKDYQQEIDQQMDYRADYWIWVVKCAKTDDPDKQQDLMMNDESWETYMYVEDSLSDHLFSLAKALPKVPSKKDVLAALAKLDAASDDWDDAQPDLLLKTLGAPEHKG